MDNRLATYTFLPWLRQGMASKIKQPDNLGSGVGPTERESVRISLQVNSDSEFASGDVQLTGPGDVIGINPRAIVRTEPRNWITDFEPNYLAYIEFYDPSFLWDYTPASAVEQDSTGASTTDTAHTKLRPWLFLMVLEENEFDPVITLNGHLPTVTLKPGLTENIFPPPEQAWAWAHVHVSEDIGGDNKRTTEQAINRLEVVMSQNADQAFSRLMCPRKLRPQTAYHAFVVPAFEVGRLAGLAQSTDGQDVLAASWGEGQTEYPIYHQWYFRTGERGDFEYLVNLLEARPVDKRVGIRDMDMQKPNFGVVGMSDGPGDLPVMGLEGALKSPESESRPKVWPPVNPPEFLNQLVDKVNLQDSLLNPSAPGAGHPDPVISPPLYGRWHALQRRLNVGEKGWVNELSQDPRNRVAAGIGTQVIQDNQETYMQKAWQQLGDVLRANQKIRQIQLAIAVSHRLFIKSFFVLKPDQQIAITAQVHPRVLGSPTTIFQRVKESRLPQAALSPAFRRMLRPRGAVMRKAVPQSKEKPTDLLDQLNDGSITAAVPKETPKKQISIDGLVPDWLPEWLRKVLASPYAIRVLLLLLVLVVAGLFIVGVSGLSAALTALSVGALASVEQVRRRVQMADRFRQENLTTKAIKQIPPRPLFKLTDVGQALPPDISQSGESDSLEAANFRTALLDLHDRFETPLPQPAEKHPLDFKATSLKLVEAINPVYAIPRRFLSFVVFPKTFKYLRPVETIVPIMAHPVFSDPMYKPLSDISSELLVPNLNLIPNNTITLMETNPRFIESYMVGLNHEMARELLWREYLTDQRGSYFRQFWDVGDVVNRDEGKNSAALEEELRDITPIHTWGKGTELGTHENRVLPTGREPEEFKLVLVIRGDLLKKYPTAVIYAQKAKWVDDIDDTQVPPRKIRVLDENNPEANRKDPIFTAQIEPDVRFIGFEMTASVAKGNATPPAEVNDPGNPGWFFCIQERPGEPRFGLDINDSQPPLAQWNDLSWNHLGDPDTIKLIDLTTDPGEPSEPDRKIRWNSNAADMAYILYQVPVLVAVHANDLLA
jgi:hypothetical protein